MIKITVENKQVSYNIDLSLDEEDEDNQVISNENVSNEKVNESESNKNEKLNETNKTEVNKSNETESNEKVNEESNKMEEINPFENIKCKERGICYFFNNEPYPESLDLLKQLNKEIKCKNKMIKFICKKYYDKEIKVYTNYYLNEIVYNFKYRFYIFIFQSFKMFVASFDVIYYFKECIRKDNNNK